MRIHNAFILQDDGVFRRGSLKIDGDRISCINLFGECDAVPASVQSHDDLPHRTDDCRDLIEAEGCYAIPGLIDLHFHGAMGYDVCDGTREAYEKISEYEASCGITKICPATLTIPADDLRSVLRTGASFRDEMLTADDPVRAQHADLVGFNMEGPFISHAKKGAQNEEYILPCDIETARSFYEASGGLMRMIGLAPEENPDFAPFIEAVSSFARVSLAHSNADYDTALRAIRAGARHAVHLYNAMPEFLHRAPGIVGAVADSPDVMAELICDGIHVHPALVRATITMMGAGRMIFISDSLRCTGMPDGIYELGGQDVKKSGRYCTLAEGGNLAGSVSNLMDCLINSVKNMGLPLETAVQCASANPAKALGIYDICGSLTPGKRADIVLLGKDLSLKAVIKDGIRIV